MNNRIRKYKNRYWLKLEKDIRENEKICLVCHGLGMGF